MKRHIVLRITGLTLLIFSSNWHAFASSKGPESMEYIKLREVVELSEPNNPRPRFLQFSPSGRVLASRQADGGIILWNWEERKVERSVTLPIGASDVVVGTPFAFSPDERFFATCHSRASNSNVVITVWSMAEWKIVRQFTDDSVGLGCIALAFSATGEKLIRLTERPLGSDLAELIEYSTKDWTQTLAVDLANISPRNMALSSDGSKLAIMGVSTLKSVPVPLKNGNGQIIRKPEFHLQIVDVTNGAIISDRIVSFRADSFTRLEWHPNSEQVFIAAGQGLYHFDLKSSETTILASPNYGQAQVGLAISAGTNRIYEGYGGEKGVLRIWDIHKKEITFSGNIDTSAIATHSEQNIIAVASAKKITIFLAK
ncbi:hypothetical protein IM543_05945 [Massilia sp. UMI-21]|nr:hypothetical protein IM543_05945 [Massilia sp. UMI-21]